MRGILEHLGRISRMIERNCAEEMKKDDGKKGHKIMRDSSLTAQERAKLLLGIIL